MAVDKRISELDVLATPTRADILTALGDGGANVQAPASDFLGLVNDTDVNFTDNTTGDVSAVQHGFAPKGSIPTPYVHMQDQKAQNTSGGAFTSGAWQTRVLNTVLSTGGGIVALASNQFTLTAGTYRITATVPAYFVDQHQARVQNITAGSTALLGQVAYASRTGGDGSSNVSIIHGEFTVSTGDAVEIQHRCTTTNASNGFGVPANFTTEVYTDVVIEKVG